jgi:hypothetical protein
MVLNGQGSGHHPLGGTAYFDLDTMLNEQFKGLEYHQGVNIR